jgi:hypothetical protein
MEGGCESGTRVADEILIDLGLKKPEKEEKEAPEETEKKAA